ncbi:hypothetical protein QBC36DRAFT_300861 [Triangularia setosa]|uniref:Uncharacterized protein n=1 Tax=Triangularia setosa TaxID=2587417 RepID=A0AAN6W7Y7_9PEZI|nr:hypothetical protein QBC36DRAFT_300861 [Podospora setosa]
MLHPSKLTTLAALLALTAPSAQQELKGALETDPLTNITFLNIHPSISPNFHLGFALPLKSTPPSKDIILQITRPTEGS